MNQRQDTPSESAEARGCGNSPEELRGYGKGHPARPASTTHRGLFL